MRNSRPVKCLRSSIVLSHVGVLRPVADQRLAGASWGNIGQNETLCPIIIRLPLALSFSVV